LGREKYSQEIIEVESNTDEGVKEVELSVEVDKSKVKFDELESMVIDLLNKNSQEETQ